METKDIIRQFIDRIASALRLECQVEVYESNDAGRDAIQVSITTTDPTRILIGTQGESLRALEHVLRLVVSRHNNGLSLLSLDVNDYKKSKALKAIEIARMALQRVRTSGKSEALPPMTSFERRAVHTELMQYPDIGTESIGEEPQRRVVIKLS